MRFFHGIVAIAARGLIGSLHTLAVLVATAVYAHASGVVVTDDRGKTLALARPAQRIVTMAPSITEMVYAAGAGTKLVGVARYSDYPPQAAQLPQVGDASRVDLERVVALRPDLVIGWKSGNQAADFERLERLGFTLYVAEPAALAAIPPLLRAIGALAGTRAPAQAAADEFERGIDRLRARYGERPRVRVFYEIWHQPLMTVNGRHMISDVIRLCGGSNVFAGVGVLTPVVSLESVLAARPEVVLGGSSLTTSEELSSMWDRYRSFSALRDIKALYVDPDYIQRQTPRVLQGAQAVCAHLEQTRGDRR